MPLPVEQHKSFSNIPTSQLLAEVCARDIIVSPNWERLPESDTTGEARVRFVQKGCPDPRTTLEQIARSLNGLFRINQDGILDLNQDKVSIVSAHNKMT